MNPQEKLKQKAAFHAVERVESNMVIGLGTGSTAKYAIERIADLLKKGRIKNIVGIPSSVQTEKQATALKIPLTSLDKKSVIDLTIDGADEVDDQLNLIKGGGGALLREKVLAQNSRRNIIIVDESKVSTVLGANWALPIEVIPFAQKTEENYLRSLGALVTIRKNRQKKPFKTDQKNIILDAAFGPIPKPHDLAIKLNNRAGIVEHGLFVNLANDVIVAGRKKITHLRSKYL